MVEKSPEKGISFSAGNTEEWQRPEQPTKSRMECRYCISDGHMKVKCFNKLQERSKEDANDEKDDISLTADTKSEPSAAAVATQVSHKAFINTSALRIHDWRRVEMY